MKRLLALLMLWGVQGSAFEEKPWFPFPYEFHFRASYYASYFSSIDGGFNPSQYNSWNQVLAGNMGFTTLSQLDMQIEAEGFLTRKTNPTMMSTGVYVRNLFYDDVQGDPISLSAGLSCRYVPDHARSDPFCPYSGLVNFELNAAVGKEFDHLQFWVYRFYGIVGVGQATQGHPWVRGDIAFEGNDRHDVNQFGMMAKSNWGFGNTHGVNIDQFSGYGPIWHQNIDVMVQYRRNFRIWGSLSLDAGYRVYAVNYPRNELFAKISYDLPFSPF